MIRSESIASLAAALVKAQAEFPVIPKTKEVLVQSQKGSYTFKYAPLEDTIRLVRPVLAKYGLGFTQGADGERLTTTVFHESGEWFEHSMPLLDIAHQQQYGAQLTYRRRFSFKSAFGIETDEDDHDSQPQPERQKRATPTVDVLDRVDPERKQIVQRIASSVVDCCNADQWNEALKAYNEVTDADEKVAVWSYLDSKMRRKLKEMGRDLLRNSVRQPDPAEQT